ncbi:MAG: hypothetical protein EOL90_00210 [Spartobacteria bacterium]|nr:hypothetical protein [Spartobacteria bacterium]
MVSRGLHGLVAAVLLLQAGCAGFRTCNDSWLGPDKAKHFAAGFVIGAGGALAARDLEPEEAAAFGWTAAMAAGFGKEAYDLRVKKPAGAGGTSSGMFWGLRSVPAPSGRWSSADARFGLETVSPPRYKVPS